jgi:hypothetical protein
MLIEVSIGEVVDKMSILELKLKFIKNEDQQKEINKEILALSICNNYIDNNKFYYNLLLYVNERIWNMTDIIKKNNIDIVEFAKISNEIFEFNQKRFRLKNFFNIVNNSNLKEQKSYSKNNCLIRINNYDTLLNKQSEINFLSIEYDTLSFKCDILSSECDFISKIQKIITIPNIIYKNNIEYIKYINLEEFNIDDSLKKIFYNSYNKL